MNRPTDKQIEDVLAGLASNEDAKLVARWFATDEGQKYLSAAFDYDLSKIKVGDEELYVNHNIPSEEIWDNINKRIRFYRIRRLLLRSAAVLIPFILLLGLYVSVDSRVDLLGNTEYEEIYVPKGERLQIMFQDGTKVFVNSDSYLRYPCKFGLNVREVELQGEAYFVVAKNEKRPFIVNLGGPAIQVVGTSFNVQAYPENNEIAVNLDEGKINMKLLSKKEVPVLPGERLIYNKTTGYCTVSRNIDTKSSSLWKNNMLVFKDMPLSEVLMRIQRWYDVEFIVDKNVSQDIFITLSSKQVLLEKILSDLEIITPLLFKYDSVHRTVNVCSKK
ncbi:FecR family protein [Phocaeicola coprocola]|uniref:FecR family protein n=1 Tax=Phocaeicola coprocola TaxID=310298 RepID=UPI0026709662|nr:FecR family protein [Phocaeicola coprocola]